MVSLQRLLQRRVIRLALRKDSTITLFEDWAFSTPPNRFIIPHSCIAVYIRDLKLKLLCDMRLQCLVNYKQGRT